MHARARFLAAFLALFLLVCGGSWAQEQELLKSQVGRYPIRVFLSQPASVGTVHVIAELGPPTQTSNTPRTRAIRIGSPPDSPYAPPAAASSPAPPDSSDFTGVEIALAVSMADMPGAKPINTKLRSTKPGRFEGDVLLTMQGDWQMHLAVTTRDGVNTKVMTVPVGGQAAAPKAGNGKKRAGLELCSDTGEDIPITVHCVPSQPRIGANTIRIELPQAATVPMMVGVDMPGMAVGIPPTEAIRQDDGSYQARIMLPMAGYWQLRVDLNGRALPPFALNVEEPDGGEHSRGLLLILLLALLPLAVWCARKRPDFLRPVLISGLLFLLVAGIGAMLESGEPAGHSGGMTMDMMASDMGLNHLTAPLPVLETTVVRSPFVIARTYAATVEPANETVVVSPGSGVLEQIVPAGTAVEAGATLARVGSSTVRAPFRGVVVRGLLNLGSEVAQSTPLLTFTDTREVALRARVPVADRAALTLGLEAQAADNDRQPVAGKVSRVSAVSQDGTCEIEAVFPGRRRRGALLGHDGTTVLAPAGERDVFNIGQEVVLEVVMERLPTSMSVPKSAVRTSADGTRTVFVVERVAGHRVARARKVTLGVSNSTEVQVLAGLEEGQTIVGNPESSLRDGDVVVPATLGEGVFRSLYVPGQASH